MALQKSWIAWVALSAALASTSWADETLPTAPPTTDLPADAGISPAPDQPAAPEKPEPTAASSETTEPGPVAEGDTPKADEAPPPPVAEAETPPPPSSGDDESARAQSVAQAKRRGVPPYSLVRPNWAFGFNGSLKALGGKDLVAAQGGAPTRAVQLFGEFQPAILQAIGVLGIGASATLYPVLPAGSVTSNMAGLISGGGQVRYQARFFREQPIVPMAGFEAQYLRYSFVSGDSGAVLLTGPFFGGMLLLNWLEPSSAAEMYVSQGVARSYLVAELRMLKGSGGGVEVQGSSLFFGLRFEM